ncbi:hypothetical protein HDV05_001503 [Chytridiales sp. JEL 0842]|nr:hypothetical protein HDV05_001503 [Chytridiales sp. JEL 0842]
MTKIEDTFDTNEFVECARYGELDNIVSMLASYIQQSPAASSLQPLFEADLELFKQHFPNAFDESDETMQDQQQQPTPLSTSENEPAAPAPSAPLPTIPPSNFLLSEFLQPLLTSHSSSGYTPLHVSTANNHLPTTLYILHLLPPSFNLNTLLTLSDSSTPLHWASLNGRLDIVRLLLSLGMDATLKNQDGRSAVTVAEQQGHLEVVNTLLATFEPVVSEEVPSVSSVSEENGVVGGEGLEGKMEGMDINIDVEYVEQ